MVEQNSRDDLGFLDGPADIAARRLLDCLLVSELPDGQPLISRIVETEAYDQSDAASHSYKPSTPRTAVMFGPAGYLYVYFTYGMHYCCNVVTGPVGHGSAVLIRAVEPLAGQQEMTLRRSAKLATDDVRLTNGPAKVCQAYGIDKALNGHDLRLSPLRLLLQDALPAGDVVQTTRVGISQAKDVAWRFYIKDNRYVSKLIPAHSSDTAL